MSIRASRRHHVTSPHRYTVSTSTPSLFCHPISSLYLRLLASVRLDVDDAQHGCSPFMYPPRHPFQSRPVIPRRLSHDLFSLCPLYHPCKLAVLSVERKKRRGMGPRRSGRRKEIKRETAIATLLKLWRRRQRLVEPSFTRSLTRRDRWRAGSIQPPSPPLTTWTQSQHRRRCGGGEDDDDSDSYCCCRGPAATATARVADPSRLARPSRSGAPDPGPPPDSNSRASRLRRRRRAGRLLLRLLRLLRSLVRAVPTTMKRGPLAADFEAAQRRTSAS